MIKKTLCFSNPIYLSLRNAQLVLHLPEVEDNGTLPETMKKEAERTIPIEDIGVVILDNRRITVTSGVLEALLENNCAVITCDQKSMPVGLLLPLCGNNTQNERFRSQLDASLPLRKQLWQQTVKQKILNQEHILRTNTDKETNCMRVWANDVRSGKNIIEVLALVIVETKIQERVSAALHGIDEAHLVEAGIRFVAIGEILTILLRYQTKGNVCRWPSEESDTGRVAAYG